MEEPFQKKVGQHETDVEGWIAIPRHFAIEDYHPIPADEDVFRTEIPMHKAFGGGGKTLGLGSKQVFQLGMAPAGCQEVRLQAELVETGMAAEQGDRLRIPEGVPVDPAEDARQRRRDSSAKLPWSNSSFQLRYVGPKYSMTK